MTSWLLFEPGVRTTPAIERTVSIMDSYFQAEQSHISSGLRTAAEQLRVIAEKALRHGIAGLFNEFNPTIVQAKVDVEGQMLYTWQRTWSKVLSLGDIVNPPLPAVVLFDYWDTKDGVKINKRGQEIGISPHMQGKSFDIKGGASIDEKAKRVVRAFNEGKCFMTGYRIEPVNNAIHVDCVML